jgi:Zn-finger protein
MLYASYQINPPPGGLPREDMMMILIVKRALISIILLIFFTAVQAADYEGSSKCRMCHKDEYEQWKDSPHALAFSNGFQDIWKELGSNPACLACHATGVDPEAGTFSHPGVTCESCHGKMSKGHSKQKAEMPLPITSEICKDCHTKTFQEWKVSRHGQNGIRCFDCHGVHEQSLRSGGGDLLCGACHSQRLEDFAHATHQLEGLHCNSCHMPMFAQPENVFEGAGVPGHNLHVGTEVCGRCHADMVHSSSQLPEMREQLMEATRGQYLTGGKGALELYEEVRTLTWKLDSAESKLWTVSILGLLVGLLLGWLLGWIVFRMFSKERQAGK